ncbi:LOB domain-containing protein 41-like [Primulina huaijiensis]|uniref:LOB domain-containing protein 41-like n=1 Tax=Primulina huaijiensis TaxID=1492673 RepID=UPI003CC6E497
MRMISCNGCRVLRRGCSEACSIKPCLEWIKCPDSQAKATIFLAKFYGRAGLLNLIDAGPQNFRPAIFRSLLYDACGRIVNPIDGSAGLLWSGRWQLCEDAVGAVLRGAPITRMTAHAVETKNRPALKAVCDIRHVNREEDQFLGSSDLHRVRTRRRFKNSGRRTKQNVEVEIWASDEPVECGEKELDLTLGLEPSKTGAKPTGVVDLGRLICLDG